MNFSQYMSGGHPQGGTTTPCPEGKICLEDGAVYDEGEYPVGRSATGDGTGGPNVERGFYPWWWPFLAGGNVTDPPQPMAGIPGYGPGVLPNQSGGVALSPGLETSGPSAPYATPGMGQALAGLLAQIISGEGSAIAPTRPSTNRSRRGLYELDLRTKNRGGGGGGGALEKPD